MVNPVFLKSFCTLVKEQHFTRTAEKLYMTQSGVSQHIKKLEEALGTALLVREGKSFYLTESGKRLYEQAKPILNALDNLADKVNTDPFNQGRVKVSSPGSVGLRLYPDLLSLQQNNPELFIEYRFSPNGDIERAVAENHCDIGLMTQVSDFDNLDCQAIGKEPLLLVTPKSAQPLSWQTLLDLGFIDHPDGAHHAKLLLGENFSEFQSIQQFKHSGFSNQIGLILEPVSRGLGFTVLPAHAVAAFNQAESICIQPLKHPVYETLYLTLNKKHHLANRIQFVIKHIKSAL
ncbi:LysR family transcriptional regulator [Catenovulum sediminis]|uniref:LysR family transcriptional regulator n=1 Tax=Catenovulum sediminis TaxID=1740262 RepID=UPI00117DDABB|nr:LysR family transcriptional regulator [Catenovulum sediminis]